MTLPGDVPYMGDGGWGGSRAGGAGGGGKTCPMRTAAGGASGGAARRLALPARPEPLSPSPPLPRPPSRPARSLARSPAARRVLNKLEEGRNAGVKLGERQLPRS